MTVDQIGSRQKTILSKKFAGKGLKIPLEAGTELNVVGKNSTHFQCLVSNTLIWVPINITETK